MLVRGAFEPIARPLIPRCNWILVSPQSDTISTSFLPARRNNYNNAFGGGPPQTGLSAPLNSDTVGTKGFAAGHKMCR